MNNTKVYIIRTAALESRATRVPFIKNPETEIILQPDPEKLRPLASSLESKVDYEKTGDPDFDKQIHPLSLEEISNIEKHRDAWRKIKAGGRGLILEDDTLLLPEFTETFNEAMRATWPNSGEPCIGFLCISTIIASSGEDLFHWRPFSEFGKILVSKDAYLINSEMASILLEKTTKYKLSLRYQLSWILSEPRLNGMVVFGSKRVFLEGSKIGIYPSSLHSNNMLILNKEYMDMWPYLNKTKEEVIEAWPIIKDIYKKIEHLKSPDAMHIYGILQYKSGLLEIAEETLTSALHEMTAQKGIINGSSDLLNNLINIYEFIQIPEVTKYRSLPAKYCAVKET